MTRSLALGLCATLCLSTVAHAQQGYSWGHFADLSADPFQSHITLVYGVPETDDIQFLAHCQIGAQGPYAVVQIRADTAGLPNGTPVRLGVTDGAGAGTFLQGTITGVNAEVGITGVEMALELDDGFFNLMRVRNALSYAIDQGTGMEIITAGVGPHLDGFLTACADPVAGGPAVTGGEPSQPVPTGGTILPGCNMIGEIRSLDANQPQTVTFTNAADGYRGIVWIDYNGSFLDMGGLNPGESMTIDSYATHPFMITDGPGNCLEVMATTPGQSSFQITAPGQFFGNE